LTTYEAAFDTGNRTSAGEPHFVKFDGASQLSLANQEIKGQGKLRHAHGFSTPLGRWASNVSKSPSFFTESELNSIGIRKGQKGVIDFVNGFRVEGIVKDVVFQNGKVLLITWVDCTVKRGYKTYFEPAWGEFDMPVGEQVVSVFGGPADRGAYGEYDMGGVSTQPGRTSPFTENEKKVFECYSKVRELRYGINRDAYESLAKSVLSEHKDEWLLLVELLEMTKQRKVTSALETKVLEMLISSQKQSSKNDQELIEWGIKISGVSD
jgi:phenylalanine-4-hydroxylase